MAPIVVRPAKRADAEGIVRAIRDGFDSSIHPLFIYGCSGVERFVSEQVGLGESDTVYTVAADGESIVGTAVIKRLDGALMLDYISTKASHRNRGLGRELLLNGIRQAGAEKRKRMLLDVFADNSVAMQWYQGLGFKREGAISWLNIPTPRPRESGAAVVHAYPQARACHEAFGFSQLEVSTGTGRYTVGLLGSEWFRLTQAAAVADLDLLSALSRMDPRRRILGIVPRDQCGPRDAAVLLSAVRMSVDLESLLACLDRPAGL